MLTRTGHWPDRPVEEQEDAPKARTVSSWRLRDAECDHIRTALQRYAWNISHTAIALEVSPTTLRKKIRDYKLARDDGDSD